MTPPRGYNPIAWNCLVSGCFNYHRHFDIEVFAQCFPRGIAMTDLDGFVELNGHFLITEFKERAADLKDGQRRAFEALTRLSDHITVIVVRCEYKSSEVYSFRAIKDGVTGNWRDCNFDQLVTFIGRWAARVDGIREAA